MPGRGNWHEESSDWTSWKPGILGLWAGIGVAIVGIIFLLKDPWDLPGMGLAGAGLMLILSWMILQQEPSRRRRSALLLGAALTLGLILAGLAFVLSI